VARKHPEIALAREAVEKVDRLRTRWITLAVTGWPIGPRELPGAFIGCLRVIRQLEPAETAGKADDLVAVVEALFKTVE